ncbi:hypothetical protein [Streptacidiphilus rugosus]|uniref:hypothetical protein n=1 Tax=Streptacidiphilus rugosus TaxID=405783 RepID=UPI0012F7E561|nr:hypothetical protein [Streptacidiphilus rugosus]
MRLGQILAPTIPLGPFAKSRLEFLAPASGNGLLHGERECGRLRSAAAVVGQEWLLEEALGRLCGHCAWPIPEDDPLIGFIEALSHLRAGTPDGTAPGSPVSRVDTCRQWRQWQTQLLRVAPLAEAYPWLRPWADPLRARLAERVEEARHAFAALLDPVALMESACAALLPDPSPDTGAVFAMLGADAPWLMQEAWIRWQQACLDGWDGPSAAAPAASAVFYDAFGARRRGRAQTLESVGVMTTRWAAAAAQAARDQQEVPGPAVTVRVPVLGAAGAETLGGDPLSPWAAGAIATYQASADWPAGTVRLQCPESVTRLLTTLTPTARARRPSA